MFSKSIGAPKIQTVKWNDVGGLIDVKEEIISAFKTSSLNLRRSGNLFPNCLKNIKLIEHCIFILKYNVIILLSQDFNYISL